MSQRDQFLISDTSSKNPNLADDFTLGAVGLYLMNCHVLCRGTLALNRYDTLFPKYSGKHYPVYSCQMGQHFRYRRDRVGFFQSQKKSEVSPNV
jgi:hypothetical protein